MGADWDAGRILRGGYSLAEQQPDADLGKPQQPGPRGRRHLLREDSAQQAQQAPSQELLAISREEQAQEGSPAAGSPASLGPAGWQTHINAAASPSLMQPRGGNSGGRDGEGLVRGKAGGKGATARELLRPIESVYRGVNEDHFR